MSDCKWLLENKTQYHNYKLHHYDSRNGYFIRTLEQDLIKQSKKIIVNYAWKLNSKVKPMK